MFGESIAKFFKVDSILNNLTGYVETKVELLKHEAREELSQGISTLLVFLLIAFVTGVMLLFVSVAFALILSNWMGYVWGFMVVGIFYLLIAIGLGINQKRLRSVIYKKINIRLKTKS